MGQHAISTIGYGNGSAAELTSRLLDAGVTNVADVRSKPSSQTRPEFNRYELSQALLESGLTYVFLGAELGGRPDDPTCYVDGHANYRVIAGKEFFKAGVDRLVAGVRRGYQIAILCSESKPEACHRSKLLGPVLVERGLDVRHLEPDGRVTGQEEVMNRLLLGQQDFGWFDTLNQSRGRFTPSGQLE